MKRVTHLLDTKNRQRYKNGEDLVVRFLFCHQFILIHLKSLLTRSKDFVVWFSCLVSLFYRVNLEDTLFCGFCFHVYVLTDPLL